MTIKTHGRMFTDNTVGITQIAVTDGSDGQALVTDGSGTLRFATVGAGGAVGSSVFVEDIRTGNGVLTTFTLSTSAPYEESIMVFIDGVAQPTSAYTLPSDTSITLSEAPATGTSIRIVHLGIASSVANNAITGAKISMGGDVAGDVLYYNGTDYQRLGIGTAGQHLATNTGATAPVWEAPLSLATATSANEIAYVHRQNVTSSSQQTWTKPAGITRIFLYITDRLRSVPAFGAGAGTANASYIYFDVTNVTSYNFTCDVYENPAKYGPITFNGRTGASASAGGSANDQVLNHFNSMYPGPINSHVPGSNSIIGYA